MRVHVNKHKYAKNGIVCGVPSKRVRWSFGLHHTIIYDYFYIDTIVVFSFPKQLSFYLLKHNDHRNSWDGFRS